MSVALTTTSNKADLSRTTRQRHFFLVLLVVNLHITRQIPGIGLLFYVAFGAVTLMAVLDFFALSKFRAAPDRHWLGAWVLLGLTGLAASIATISLVGSVYGLVRFWFALPLYIALLAYCRDKTDITNYTRIATYFFTFAVLTIPLQVAVGPIEWFKDGSERGEFHRYASLLGGLNSAGGTAGVFIILCQLIPGRKKWLFMATISASVVMDLSKSGIASTGVALLVVLLMNVRKLATLVTGGAIAGGIAYVIFALVPSARQRLETTLISFGVESDSGLRNSDKTVTESAVDRLTELPLHNIQTWLELPGLLKFPIGGGFGMASTALVPSEDSLALMSHNQFVEILTVWGFIGVIVLFGVIWRTIVRLGRAPSSNESPVDRQARLIYLVAFLLLLGRYMFANGSLYHPASATPLFLCLIAAALYSRPSGPDEGHSRAYGPPSSRPTSI